MKFISFYYGGEENVGILMEDYIVPINEIALLNNKRINSMLELIEAMNKELMHQLDKAVTDSQYRRISLNAVKILAPIPYPKRNIFCLGKNYADHAREIEATRISDSGIPEYPVYFTKTACPAVADGDNIVFSDTVTGQVDYEVELAIIIGKKGTYIKPENAEDYIFGYTIINDISARDLQVKHKQWFKAKSLDTFCPMGPVIADKREIPFPVDLKIRSRINGELRQDSQTGNMIFSIPYIISDLSRGLTLMPGDIISTGTPSGVGMGFKPPRFLAEGDIVECYIEKIGTLTNRICIV